MSDINPAPAGVDGHYPGTRSGHGIGEVVRKAGQGSGGGCRWIHFGISIGRNWSERTSRQLYCCNDGEPHRPLASAEWGSGRSDVWGLPLKPPCRPGRP
jgi:hypothetical protein